MECCSASSGSTIGEVSPASAFAAGEAWLDADSTAESFPGLSESVWFSVFAIATPAQRNKIEALRIDLGWKPDGLAGFLHDRRHADGRRMTRIESTTDAAAVIELLKVVVAKSRQAQDRREAKADGVPGVSEHGQGQAQDEHRESEADRAAGPSERRQDQAEDRRESERAAAVIVTEHRQDEASRQGRREGPSAALGATDGASPICRAARWFAGP